MYMHMKLYLVGVEFVQEVASVRLLQLNGWKRKGFRGKEMNEHQQLGTGGHPSGSFPKSAALI